jgi:DNA processing protein
LKGEKAMNTEEKICRACLLSIPGIGSGSLRQILAIWGSAQNAIQRAPAEAGRLLVRAKWPQELRKYCAAGDAALRQEEDKLKEVLAEEDIKTVAVEEELYPFLLKECQNPPPLLFYKGEITAGAEGIGIVGARRASPYGKAAARKFAGEIVEGGYVVVSGLARGIDGAAHTGALSAKGATWAFMAGGLEHVYPNENKELARRIVSEGGALISEYPPGTPWEPERFPARNRLISGVSRGVVVVEAGERSGSLITADFALEQSRDVFAVPGPVFNETSLGTHQLLKSGAILATCGADVLAEYTYLRQPAQGTLWDFSQETEGVPFQEPQDSPTHSFIESFLGDTPLHIDALAADCDLNVQELSLRLLELELQGKVHKLPGPHYVLARA